MVLGRLGKRRVAMNNRFQPKRSEVWFAWQPWFTNDKTRVETYPDGKTGMAHIPVTEHPALLLARGDTRGHGWLVCYFSTKADTSVNHPQKEPLGDVLERGKASYFENTAPQYCPEYFIKRPYQHNGKPLTVDPNLLRLIYSKSTCAMKIRVGQDDENQLAEIIRNWFECITRERILANPSPESVMDDAIGEGE